MKVPKYTFCRGFNSEFYYDDVYKHYIMAMLPLKSSHKEQPSVIRLLWQKDLAQMPFSLRCIQYMVTSILQDQQYMFGVKSLLIVEIVLLTRKNLVAVLF